MFVDSIPPVVSDVRITDVSATGYTVSCTVTDNASVDRVQFPSWTDHVVDGKTQDDIVSEWWTNPAVRGTRDVDRYTFRVNIWDHGYEQGMYRTHIYAYDACDNAGFADGPGAKCAYQYGPDMLFAYGSYRLLSAADTKYALDVTGESVEVAANVQIWEDLGNNAQRWTFSHCGDCSYKLMAACSGYILDSWCGTYARGANVVQHPDLDGDNQKWYIEDCGDGTYALKCKKSDMFLDINGMDMQNGTNVHQYEGNGSAAQKWYIVPNDVSRWSVSVSDQTWSGSALTPSPKVNAGGVTLVEGRDYTVSYRNNINAGIATATITGKGGYEGAKNVMFLIKEESKTFSDVPEGAWYAWVVSRAVALGLMSGYDNGRFGPDDSITRGQVAVILWNMAGRPAAGSGAKPFSDVASGKYYYNAVRWASGAGVVSGYSNKKFDPNDKVTREQLTVMLANYARRVGGQQVSGSPSDYASMKDKAKVSSWAVTSMGWCFRNKILSGSRGCILPQDSATRAETAKMVVDLYYLLA